MNNNNSLKSIISIDEKCLSCAGHNIEKALKTACLKYNPNLVK